MEMMYTNALKIIEMDSLVDRKVVIRPFGDLHCDSEAFDYDRWKETIKQWKKTDTPYTFYLGMGDLIDFVSMGEGKAIDSIKSQLHLETMKTIDKTAMRLIDEIAKDLEFMRGRILGFIEGNHTYTFLDTKTSTDILCEKFNTKNLGWLTYLRLTMRTKREVKALNYDIVACHGRSGGKLIGTSINQVDEMKKVFPAADLYLFAHDHQKYAVPTETLIASNANFCMFKIKQKEQYLCRTGSYLKSYEPNKKGYVINMLRRPASLGSLELQISFIIKAYTPVDAVKKVSISGRKYRKQKVELFFKTTAII